MKKLQLRNIIRESINQLMIEQQYACDPPQNGCPPGESWLPAPDCMCSNTTQNPCPPCDALYYTTCSQWLSPSLQLNFDYQNFSCCGPPKFQWLYNHMLSQITPILTNSLSLPSNMIPMMFDPAGWNTFGYLGAGVGTSGQGWQTIKNWVNNQNQILISSGNPGFPNPSQLKRKIAKALYARCMIDKCSC